MVQIEVNTAEHPWTLMGVHTWLVSGRGSGEVVGRARLPVMHLHAHTGATRSFPRPPLKQPVIGDTRR